MAKESERERLEERRQEVEGLLLEATKERAQWERHLQELKEAREAIRRETGDQGELHTMKTEITRMQVSQVRSSQVKLGQMWSSPVRSD